MKRVALGLAVIIYLIGIALWAKHADLPLQSGAAIEASATQNTLKESCSYGSTVRVAGTTRTNNRDEGD